MLQINDFLHTNYSVYFAFHDFISQINPRQFLSVMAWWACVGLCVS